MLKDWSLENYFLIFSRLFQAGKWRNFYHTFPDSLWTLLNLRTMVLNFFNAAAYNNNLNIVAAQFLAINTVNI